MNIPSALSSLDAIIASAQQAKADLTAVVPTILVVRAGESLQAALDTHLPVEVEAGAIFEGHYTAPSGTRLAFRAGSGAHGKTGPALTLLPGTKDSHVIGGELTSDYAGEVVLIGNNVDQRTLADQPTNIGFTGTRVPMHRGRRAFGIHAYQVTLQDCEVLDCWSAAGEDSQAVYVGNAQGAVTLNGGRYQAGSEVFLAGGDAVRTPGLVPDGIVLDGVELSRPLSWQTDGVKRKVKNLFEVKSGRHVILRNSRLSGCWADGQTGEAIVLTPALDGAKTTPVSMSGIVEDVLIENNDVRHVGATFNILGRNYSAYTPTPLTGLLARKNVFLASKALYGGTGQFAKIGGEPGTLTFEDNIIVTDGSSLIYFYRGSVIESDGFVHGAGNLQALAFRANYSTIGAYGINLDGYANAGAGGRAAVTALDVSGNTFGGGTLMKANLPSNTYLTRAAFDALPEVQAAVAGA